MKKLNNKGFLLVETVIVSVFVLTLFVLIYQNSVPMINEYDQRAKYDDIDSIYGLSLIRNLVLMDTNYLFFLKEVNSNGYKEIKCSDLEKQTACENITTSLNMTDKNHIYISKWDVSELAKNNELSNDFLDYVLYVKKQNQPEETKYRIISSRTSSYVQENFDDTTKEFSQKTITEYHYANLGIE